MVRVKQSARDRIKAAQDRPQEIVKVPELDVVLYVRGMSAADVMGLGSAAENPEAFAKTLLSLALHDEEGNRVYPTPEDAEELMSKSFPIVQRLLMAARRVNGIDGEELKKD